MSTLAPHAANACPLHTDNRTVERRHWVQVSAVMPFLSSINIVHPFSQPPNMNRRNNSRQNLKVDTANTSRPVVPPTSTFTPPWSTRDGGDTALTTTPPSSLPNKPDQMQKPTPTPGSAPKKSPQQARQQQQPTPPNSATDDVSTIAGALVQTQELAKTLARAVGRLEAQASQLSSSKASLEAQQKVYLPVAKAVHLTDAARRLGPKPSRPCQATSSKA